MVYNGDQRREGMTLMVDKERNRSFFPSVISLGNTGFEFIRKNNSF